MEKMFFNSSMPRSGSTLLQNVLGQNPDFYVSPTSGLLELVYAARANYTDSLEFKAQDPELMKKAFLEFCRSGMRGYYESITDVPYVMDKSRGWGIHYGFLQMITVSEPKVVVMVRDLREIISSMEKNFRKNPDKHDKIVNHSTMSGTSTPKRVDIWFGSPPVGIAVERLAQMIREGIDKKVHFVKFEDFCRKPDEEMRKIYEYLGVPYYKHDFNNVEQLTKEDDEVYGIYGDHKVRKKIEPVPFSHNTVLGKDVSDWIYNSYKWYFDYFKYSK